jgi:hypothetical protein
MLECGNVAKASPKIGKQMNANIGKVDGDQQNRWTLRLTEEAKTWAAADVKNGIVRTNKIVSQW